MINRTFTTALPGHPSNFGCALRRIAFPLDPRTPEYLLKIVEAIDRPPRK